MVELIIYQFLWLKYKSRIFGGMEDFMLRKGMFLADRYEILEQIGTGGMSDVYKAKCHKLNR